MLNTTTLKWSLYIVKSIGKILCVTSPNANHWPTMTFGYIRLSFLNIRNLWFYLKSSLKKKHMQKYLTKFEKKKFLIIGIISEKYY
jgi:hypothetical protein